MPRNAPAQEPLRARSLKLPIALDAAMQAVAAKERRSVNSQITTALAEWLQTYSEPTTPPPDRTGTTRHGPVRRRAGEAPVPPRAPAVGSPT
jgi:hypothetical protein